MDLKRFISQSASSIVPDLISTFNQQIAGIDGLIPLTIGEPDFNTPEHIKEAAIQAVEQNESHYTNPQGTAALRTAAVNYLHAKYGLTYDADSEVVATAGVSEGLLDTFLAILNPGDEVILPTPAFPVYEGAIRVPGGKPVFVDISKDGFKLTPERLEAVLSSHNRVKALLLNYPSNPTGVTYQADELAALAKVIEKHDILVISDEIYSELCYDQPHASIATLLPEQTILFNGLSKSHAMTGWRVGFVFAKPALLSEIFKMHMFASFSITSVAQAAAVEALNNGRDDALPMKAEYQKRRDLVLKGLAKVGITSPTPAGAFYIFATVPDSFKGDSMAFGLALAKEAKVGVVPGIGFGPGGENYFRISYAASESDLSEAVRRIQEFVRNHEPSKK